MKDLTLSVEYRRDDDDSTIFVAWRVSRFQLTELSNVAHLDIYHRNRVTLGFLTQNYTMASTEIELTIIISPNLRTNSLDHCPVNEHVFIFFIAAAFEEMLSFRLFLY